jgi:hypothetical protein
MSKLTKNHFCDDDHVHWCEENFLLMLLTVQSLLCCKSCRIGGESLAAKCKIVED